MRRLLLEGPGNVRWDETDDPPPPSKDSALVQPVAVATCDIDVAILRGRYPTPGAPYPLGHEGIGTVVAVGAEVRSVTVGDLVVIPFQISCGHCDSCRRERTGNCRSQPRMSTYGLGNMGGYGWGGFLADWVQVPHADAMLVPVPGGLDPVMIASCSDNLPDAWRSVGPHLEREPGIDVLVMGGDAGPAAIGLYASGIAVAMGAGRVVYHDHDPARLSIAATLGAECTEGRPPRKLGAFPVAVDATGSDDGLRCAINSTASDGICTSVSVYLSDPTLPLLAMYSRCCTFHTGRAHVRPAIPAVLDLVTGGFDPSAVTSMVVPWDDAVEALSDPPLKLVITRGDPA
jgi:alcohol dehydrogenase